MIIADYLSILAIMCYLALGSYAVFKHVMWGYILCLGQMSMAILNVSWIDFRTAENIPRTIVRLIIFYAIYRLIKQFCNRK